MAKRFLMWVLCSAFLSILILSFIPISYYLTILALLSLALIIFFIIKCPLKITIVSCLIAAVCSTGMFYLLNKNVERLWTPLLDQTVAIQGKIADVGSNSAQSLSCYKIRVDKIEEKNVPLYNPFYVYVYCDNPSYRPGDRLCGPIQFFETPIEYGYGKEDRVFIAGYQAGEALEIKSVEGFDLYSTIYSFRNSIQSKISFGSKDTQGLLKAVCFGDKSEIDPSLYYSLKRTGLSHVMAVSGLHLSFAVAFFGFLFLLFGVDYRIRHIIGIFVALFFTFAVGFPASCIRACVMLVIFSIGMAMNWFSDSLTSLSLAIFIILLLNPFSVRDIGFLLSISATAGIITLQSPIENFLFPKKLGKDYRVNEIYRKFTGIISCSLAAMIATLPITVLVFGSVSVVAPIVNALLIFPFELLFMLGILMIAFGWIPFVGVAIGTCCDVLYWVIKSVSAFFSGFEFASIGFLDSRVILFCILFAFIFGVSLYFFLRYQKRTFIILFSLFLCFAFLFNGLYSAFHPNEDLKIAFVDVGQGDCSVLSKGDRAVVIDYGGSSDKRYNLISYLKEHNITTVEQLMFTHLHNDHTNGVFTLAKNSHIENLIYPPFESDYESLNVMFDVLGGQEINGDSKITVLDDVEIEIYADAALAETSKDENERCICYKVNYGSTSLLITGDLDGRGEMELLQRDLDCTILKVGHHGSETSSFYPFLKAAAPEMCIVSVGKNQYGLPDTAVLERIKTICNNVLLTENEGTICFVTDGKILERINS